MDKKKIGKCVVILCAIGFGLWYFGWNRWWFIETAAESRLEGRAINIFSDKEDVVDETSDFEKAARIHHEAKNELSHNRELIANGPQTCARIQDLLMDDKGYWTEVTMDLTGCSEGQTISLHFGGNQNFPTVWRIEVFTEDGTLAPRPPDVQVREEDGFNAVEKVKDKPNVFALKGERIYLFHKEGRTLKCAFLKAVS